VALFPDASIIDRLGRDALERDGLPPLDPAIVRYTLTPGREHAAVDTLVASGFDFPAINYRRCSGRRHAVSWGARIEPGMRSSLVRLDASGELRSHADPDHIFGEPTFVARPDASAEDDGVLLTVGSHRSADRSELRILDARTMQPLARASVPLPIALGFHGSFFRDRRA
jgi:beta,beta-carotene 9',10'-dioxygenase